MFEILRNCSDFEKFFEIASQPASQPRPAGAALMKIGPFSRAGPGIYFINGPSKAPKDIGILGISSRVPATSACFAVSCDYWACPFRAPFFIVGEDAPIGTDTDWD